MFLGLNLQKFASKLNFHVTTLKLVQFLTEKLKELNKESLSTDSEHEKSTT